MKSISWRTEEYYEERINKLKATVDRQRELLKRYDKNKKVCMFCNTRYHTDDCELAEALDAATDAS